MNIKLFAYALTLSLIYLALSFMIEQLLFKDELKTKKFAPLQSLTFFIILFCSGVTANILFNKCQSELRFDYPKLCTDPFGLYFVWTPILLIMANLMISSLILVRNKIKKAWWGLFANLLLCLVASAIAMFMSLYMT